jgi:phosphatidate phosphatase APP1
MDSDRAKNELGHAREKITDCYIQSSFLPKEHRMLRHVRDAVQAFESYTSCQAEHENRSLKALGGTKPQQNIHRSAVAMVNKEEHRYQVKAPVSGRAIMATQLWSKSITAQSLTIHAEGLCRAQVTRKNNYFVKSIGQFYYYVVAKKLN